MDFPASHVDDYLSNFRSQVHTMASSTSMKAGVDILVTAKSNGSSSLIIVPIQKKHEMGVDHQWEMFRRLQQGPFSKGWIAGPKWKSWTDIVPKFVFQEGVSYFQFLDPRGWGQNGRKWAGCGNGQLYNYIYLYIWFGHIHGNSDLNSENSGLLHPPNGSE